MEVVYKIPQWFFGINIILDFIFALAAAIVAIYAFKIYKISDQREPKLLGTAFTLMSISYIILIYINLFFVSILEDNKIISLQDFNSINNLAVYAHILIFALGLLTLLFATFKNKDKSQYTLIIVISLAAIIFSINKAEVSYILSSIFLAYICIHYAQIYLQKKNFNSALIFTGLIFLLASKLTLAIQIIENIRYNYVISHILELISYVFIIISLSRIIKHGQKKK